MASADELPRRPEPLPAWQQFASAPLLPLALSFSCGLLFDRYIGLGVVSGLVLVFLWVLAWFILRTRVPVLLASISLGAVLFAAGSHHLHRNSQRPDDIGLSLSDKPALLAVRGTLADQPFTRRKPQDPLQPTRRRDVDVAILEVTHLRHQAGNWQSASGRLRLSMERETDANTSAPMGGLNAGDAVEVLGLASVPEGPTNPGERDVRETYKDQRLRGDLRTTDTTAAIVRLQAAEISTTVLLAQLHGRATRVLTSELPESASPTARALLLADGSAMDRSEWDAFIRTGVVHVLAISGQHLVVLAAFVWFVAGLMGLSRSQAAWLVLAVVALYAGVTGFRPSAMRATVMVAAVCGAVVLRRPVHTANAFAAAWIVVVLLNPTDPFSLGCKLSFLSVFVLIWGVRKWLEPNPPSQIERLVEIFRPLWLKWLRAVGQAIVFAYKVNLALFAVNTPLLITEQNMVSPIGLLIGPILVVFSSLALISGFLLFVLSWMPGMTEALGAATQMSLGACNSIVHWADAIPGGCLYLPSLPMFWLIGFYLLVALLVLLQARFQIRLLMALFLWVLVALILPWKAKSDGELRLVYLNVGHGNCTVLETPDGRVLLYDIGTLSGPDAVRRTIAPYLWSRGIRSIDEVFLSHADTDHFNNLAELLRRFTVGRISLTPSFSSKPSREVAETLLAIQHHAVPMRIVKSGDRFAAGAVELEVLHPPESSPRQTENERSLVLLIRYLGHTFLLPGDLEQQGTTDVIGRPPVNIDVLLAPHHGSVAAFPAAFRAWANPRFVVLSRGQGFGAPISKRETGAEVWNTQTTGAVTVSCHRTGITAEAFRDGTKIVISRSPSP